MKVLGLLLLVSALSASVWVAKQDGKASGSAESKAPADAVSDYCRVAEQGDFQGLKNLTTGIPGKYWEYQSRKAKQAEPGEGSAQTAGGSGRPDEASPVVPMSGNNASLWLVNSSFPRILFENKEGLKRITRTFVKDDEARVIAVIGFRSVERDGQEWEFFLHREDQRWLIFRVTLPGSNDAYASQ
jgi:hypothetical protein